MSDHYFQNVRSFFTPGGKEMMSRNHPNGNVKSVDKIKHIGKSQNFILN